MNVREIASKWTNHCFSIPTQAVWGTTGSLTYKPTLGKLRAEANADILIRSRKA
jgi:hypothetical protein